MDSSADPPAAQAQALKQVSILFLDIVGSTALSQHLDPEDLSAVLDVEDPIKGEWTLEVSSAGIDRPLTRAKDWNRFAGHVAQLELLVPQDGRKRFKGIALGADAETARLRLEDVTDVTFPRSNIRRAKLVLTDELIAATAAPRQEN